MTRKSKKVRARTFQCVKCGTKDISATYREKGEQLDREMGAQWDEAKVECLFCYCRGCGFTWTEPRGIAKPKRQKA